TAIVLLVAVVHLVGATPRYTATTQVLLLEKSSPPTEGRSGYYQGEPSYFIENQLAVIGSDSLLRRVVIRERLGVPPPDAKPQGTGEDESKPDENQSTLDAINTLRGALGVSRSGKGLVLKISITWQDPTRAAQLANAVAEAYVLDQLDARFEAAKQ